MLLPPPMDYGPMKVKYLTHESCCSGFDFPFIKYTGHGGAPHLRIYFLEQHDGVFLGDMVYLQQSYPPNSTIHGSKSSLSMGKGPRAACCSVYYSVHHIDRLAMALLPHRRGHGKNGSRHVILSQLIFCLVGWKIPHHLSHTRG